MAKKYIFSVLLSVMFLMSSPALAATNCNNQPKPAFGCPTGYSMMCISAGGDHWGCGKESNGAIIEVAGLIETSGSTESSGVKSTMQTQVKISGEASGEPVNETNSQSIERQTPKRDFGDRVKAGLDTAAKVTVRGWDPEKKEAIQETVATQLENDSAIKSVEITEKNVSMVYSTPATLFGFIAINMNLRIFADAEGKVTVKFPWYRFLVKTEFANAQETLNEVFQNNETDLDFLKIKGSAEAQVGIFTTISKVMHEISKSIIQNIRA